MLRGDPQETPSHERIDRADLLTRRRLLPEGAEEGPSALFLAQPRGLCSEQVGRHHRASSSLGSESEGWYPRF